MSIPEEREKSPDQIRVEELRLKQPLSTITFTAPQLLYHYYGKTHPKHIQSMDKGMGKTVAYLSVALLGEPEYVIIACPTNAMAAQRRELLRHFPFYADKFVFVRGQKHQRHKLWRLPKQEARIFICTPSTLQTDLGGRELRKDSGQYSNSIVPPWVTSSALDHFQADEFQKYCRRPKSGTFKQLKKLSPETLILDSGSPVSTGPHELWPALHLVDRKFWSSYWNYVDRFCVTHDGHWGKEIIGPKNVEQWRMATAPYVFHRQKDPRDYPPKSRFILDFELEPWQRKLHDQLRNELWAITDSGIITARNTLDALYRARLGLICPRAIDSSFGIGSGIEGIADDASELSHFVVSTPFRAPIPHLRAYLESLGRRVWVLSGGLGIGPDDQDRIIAEFQSTGGCLIQTIKYATSYEFIHGPEHNYFLGYEYDPEDNKQAEDRFQRISSTRPSFHWYVRFLGTYDEDLIEALVAKSQNVTRLMNDGRAWKEILK
jgi:hypothetical protein